jgi:hypothetical protein
VNAFRDRTPPALHDKRALLFVLYEVYEEIAAEFPAACRKECLTCCTHNVLSCTLEVDLILEFLRDRGRQDLVHRMLTPGTGPRMRPALSINELAGYCLRREEPPLDAPDFDSLPCPLREPEGCPIYPVRPFSCRALWSSRLCTDGGSAIVHPFLVTLGGMFEQMIEHVDAGGLCGNMLDLAAQLGQEEQRSAYRAGDAVTSAAFLTETHPNPGFLVAPGHRKEAAGVMDRLRTRTVNGLSFREALDAVRRVRTP